MWYKSELDLVLRKIAENRMVIGIVMGQLSTKTDVAVIGAGPGGYTAAIRAAQLGLDVVLIEKDKLGGCCTNVGCIPTKALIHAAEVKHEIESQNTRKMGIDASIRFDFRKTQQWKSDVVKSLREGVGTLCKLNGVEIIDGRAFFTSSRTLSIETESGLREIEFKNAIIATGTRVNALNKLLYDHKVVIDSDDALALDDVPERILVVGGGYVAVEMACMFMRFGSKVTIVYRGERLLKNMEPEVTEVVERQMQMDGCEILFKSEIESVDKNGKSARIKTPNGIRTAEFDKILVAVGREPYFEGLELEKTKVTVGQDSRVIVDKNLRTTDKNIFAVGDVVPGPQLAHKAFREGKVAAEVIAGQKSEFDNRVIPMVVFATPTIASVGLSEEEAKVQYAESSQQDIGSKVKVGKMPFSASGRARTINETDGFVKVIARGDGLLLGVHIVGPDADSLIAEAAFALENGAMLEDLAITIHAHPTLPETLSEAAEDALGKAIHIYRGKERK